MDRTYNVTEYDNDSNRTIRHHAVTIAIVKLMLEESIFDLSNEVIEDQLIELEAMPVDETVTLEALTNKLWDISVHSKSEE